MNVAIFFIYVSMFYHFSRNFFIIVNIFLTVDDSDSMKVFDILFLQIYLSLNLNTYTFLNGYSMFTISSIVIIEVKMFRVKSQSRISASGKILKLF